MSPKERNRRDNFPLQVGSAASCGLETDTEDGLPPFNNSLKRTFWNIVSQGEFETG
jgi:hypothetical protein